MPVIQGKTVEQVLEEGRGSDLRALPRQVFPGAKMRATALTAGELHIPSQDADDESFHVNALGDAFWGVKESTFDEDRENAIAYILKTGVAKFQSIILSGYSQLRVATFGGDGADGVLSVSSDTSEDTIAYDATSASGEGSSVSTRSWAHVCSSGDNRILLVLVASRDSLLADRTVSSVTYNSVALTKARSDDNNDIRHSEIWYLVAPATGSNTVLVTMGGTCTAVSAVAVSLTGAAQTSPIDTSGGVSVAGPTTSTSVQLTTITANAWIVDILHNSAASSAWVPGGDQTSRYSLNGSGQDMQVSTRPTTTAGIYTNTWIWTTSAWRATTVVVIKPGTLTVSDTFTLDLGGESVATKNYESISILGAGKLLFSNPHANGTIVILKSKGDVIITSTATPAIDLRGVGAEGGTGFEDGSEPTGLVTNTNSPAGQGTNSATGGVAGNAYDDSNLYATSEDKLHRRALFLVCGTGGAGGGSGGAGTPTTGGRGGGALLIECAGSLNFTGVVNSSGGDGEDATTDWGGAGGGSAGVVVILYNTLTANSGTITTTGGSGGDTVAGTGSAGGGGAGSVVAAGGAGGDSETNGSAASGAGAGGGGAGIGPNTGGAGGVSMSGLVAENNYFF